ncbi:unannotated protein [freshwater metagenome]|uniref:Unannotated protein n=1 Tax=freshwater metagenome TaxID=449393 RepID=A0A6J6HVW1_9ZZZZ
MLGETETWVSIGITGSVLLSFSAPNQFSLLALWISFVARVCRSFAANSFLFLSGLSKSRRKVETSACGVKALGRSTLSASIEETPFTNSYISSKYGEGSESSSFE